MTALIPNAALAGPWSALISHRGESYDSIRTALIELGERGEVDISVRRGTALPHEDDDGYLPGTYATGDVAYELDFVPLTPDDDPATSAEARFVQAQAMAAGLNAAGQVYGSGCHCTFLGEGTPEHTPSALCRSLRPDAERTEMQPPPCADHLSSELGCPVCSAQRRAFYAALGREIEGGEPS